jgi:hypothetical protein
MRHTICLLAFLASTLVQAQWKEIAPGLEHRVLSVTLPEYSYPININAIRIDPHKWDLFFRGISQEADGPMKTSKEWCEKYNITAAINAGMYNDDYQTHTGYVRDGEHRSSIHRNSYKSLLAFNPRKGRQVPPARIFDLDQPGVTIDSVLKDYSTVIQNLRLIKRPGISVWPEQGDRWSEAALAEDKQGRILFLYCSSAVSMHDFNKILLYSDLEIVAAQHLEGNAPAQVYLKTGETELILSEEPGLDLPLPNIIGIRPKGH